MAPRNSCHSWIMQRTNQNPENVSASEKSLNKSPEVTGSCSKYADCRGYTERLAAFFSTVLVCLDTISHAACGAISYQLAGPRHKTQKSISPVDTGAMTPHSSHPHGHIPHTGVTQEAPCQALTLSRNVYPGVCVSLVYSKYPCPVSHVRPRVSTACHMWGWSDVWCLLSTQVWLRPQPRAWLGSADTQITRLLNQMGGMEIRRIVSVFRICKSIQYLNMNISCKVRHRLTRAVWAGITRSRELREPGDYSSSWYSNHPRAHQMKQKGSLWGRSPTHRPTKNI